jgi:nucleotide-binding universal stress UspA family protein
MVICRSRRWQETEASCAERRASPREEDKLTSAEGTTTTRRRIVVGVDGSESSLAALRWAVRQAELTGAPLEVVSAWEWPVSYSGWETPLPPDYDPADEARRQLDKAVSAVLTPGDAIEVRQSVIEGHPAPVLEALSKTADLVVVGSHGHGEFVGMLLGSVSEHCVTHCHCPVVVIRGTGRRAQR